MKYVRRALAATLPAVLVACAPPVEPRGPRDAGAQPARADARPPDPLAPFCGEGARPRPGPLDTQGDVVALLDSLPLPLGLPCVLAALPRPIAVVGSSNPVSAQPASGPRNPRLFVRAGGRLILSLALSGPAIEHLETAEWAEPGYSVKGDLEFPLAVAVAERDFFVGIVNARHSATACSACHAGEHAVREAGDVPAFASRALEPPSSQLVPLTAVRGLADDCAAEDAADQRCQMLRALFRAPDAVEQMQFLEGTTTWF